MAFPHMGHKTGVKMEADESSPAKKENFALIQNR